MLVLVEETSKEGRFLLFILCIQILYRGRFLRVHLFDRFVRIHPLIDDRHRFMAVQKVGVGGIDVTSLHGDHIRDELVCRCHAVLEKVDDDKVETVFELGVAFECGLSAYSGETYCFSQQLA